MSRPDRCRFTTFVINLALVGTMVPTYGQFMFLADTHLPQLLAPSDYVSAERHARERERIFRPSWQYVGTIADIPKPGDYFTHDFFGEPLLVWHTEGGVKAYLNVCPHRFARLTSQEKGHAGDRMQCQYHGWEFDGCGQTKKIPDAPSFKPMSKGALCLTPFRTETVGQLIFVTADDDAPPLEEALGLAYEVAADWCSFDLKHFYTMTIDVEANWKTKIENALESYHVDLIHPTTFGRTPEAERCEHQFEDGWSSFTSHEPCEQFLDRLIHKLVKQEPDLEYKHYLFYPNLMFGKMRLFRWVEAIVPVSPTRLRIHTSFFCYRGSGGLRSRLLTRSLANWGKKFFTKVSWEDANILEEVQRGLAAPAQPSTGVISIREERVHHFQAYVQTALTSHAPREQTADMHPQLAKIL